MRTLSHLQLDAESRLVEVELRLEAERMQLLSDDQGTLRAQRFLSALTEPSLAGFSLPLCTRVTSFVRFPATFCSLSCCEKSDSFDKDCCCGLKTECSAFTIKLNLKNHQMSEFCRQASVGLLHVHHLHVGAQNVELAKPEQGEQTTATMSRAS